MAVSSDRSGTRVEPASQQTVLKAEIEIERHDKQSRFPFVVFGQKLPVKSCYYFTALSLAA